MFYLSEYYEGDGSQDKYGSKAANLSRLADAGYRVPTGFAFAPDDPVGDISQDTLNVIVERATNMGRVTKSTTWAVRSSGLAEDGDDSSYAGQHDTYLNVEVEDILARILDCRASGVKAEAYREAKGEEDKGIAVLVQMMVPSYMSGVTFTSNPFDMDLTTSVIEYTPGLGDKLVGGEVNPQGSYEVNNATEEYNPRLTSSDYDRCLPGVWSTCKRIAELFGQPMDIEWAIDHDYRLWILQARPLTTGGQKWNYPELKGRAVVKGRAEGVARWAEGDAENMHFDEGNILFARMTNPHMVPLMMKSSGIATQIGGRTCHAAIVSRELNKPCVVSIGNLSVLQSGIKVVLDANKGTVEA